MIKRLMAMFLAAVCALNCASAQQTPDKEAPFDGQMRAMGYFIYSLSGINAINGINLTPEQAQKLRTLAREIQSVSPAPPDLNAPFRPDLAEVRDTYLEVRKEIIKGAEVSPELEHKTGKARGIESEVIRLSLKNAHYDGSGSCASCHGAPEVLDVRNVKDAVPLKSDNAAVHSPLERDMAHIKGLFGLKGVFKLAKLAPEVDQILTAEQKDVFDNFSCCLVPPQSFKDPVRAGQAAGGEKLIDILRWVRATPSENWPQVKVFALGKLDNLLLAIIAGPTAEALKTAREKAGEICEKARGLSDTDFELQKDALAAELQDLSQQKNTKGGHKSFQTALFLLFPGVVEVYDNFIERHKEAQANK